MKDFAGNKLEIGDVIYQRIDDHGLKKDSRWRVVEFGIEIRTGKKICVIKSIDKSYIASCYQSELQYFIKEVV